MESSATTERHEPNTGHAGTEKQSSTIAKKTLAGDIALERHYSVCELAQLWGLSEKTIRRMFVDEPGVMKWGHEEGRFKRRGPFQKRVHDPPNTRECGAEGSPPLKAGRLTGAL
jgi:hypothetical protein